MAYGDPDEIEARKAWEEAVIYHMMIKEDFPISRPRAIYEAGQAKFQRQREWLAILYRPREDGN